MRLMLFILLAVTVCVAVAQEGDEGSIEATDRYSESENCIRTRSIRRTRAIDDSTIAFYMRDRDLVYINVLPDRCPQLARYNRFAYESRGGRLCRSDVITVLMQFAGRLERGFSCRLGSFQVSDPDSVEIQIQALDSGSGPGAVTAESVELPPEGDAESAAADAETDVDAD